MHNIEVAMGDAQTSDKGRAFYLKNMLLSMQMEEGESISEHLLKLKDIRDQLLSI
jgi:hypothetical protein